MCFITTLIKRIHDYPVNHFSSVSLVIPKYIKAGKNCVYRIEQTSNMQSILQRKNIGIA